MDAEDVYVDDNAHTGCYVFRPAQTDQEEVIDQRPKKRRKLENSSTRNQERRVEGRDAWPSLLGGQEPAEAIRRRQQLFAATWPRQQDKIDAVINKVDESFVDNILDYVRAEQQDRPNGRIKAALLVSTPGRDAERDLVQDWEQRHSTRLEEILIQLQPSQAPNIQIALKNVIRLALSQKAGPEEYTNFLAANKAMIPMNFDLELLQRYADKKGVSRVLVSLPDVEAFDTGILCELISIISSWADRIPFVLLTGISTTIALLESRLPRSIISLLDARVFQPFQAEGRQDPLFDVYSAVQGPDAELFLGPSTITVLAELAQEQGTTVETFMRAIKYVFMSHFFANPLSLLAIPDTVLNLSHDSSTAQAIRNTVGFRSHCESLAKGTKTQRQHSRNLLTSDAELEKEVLEAVRSGQERIRSSLLAICTLRGIYQQLLGPAAIAPLEAQSQLLASLPDLTQSDIFEATETALKEMLRVDDFHVLLRGISEELEDLNSFMPSAQSEGSDQEMLTLATIQEALNSDDTIPNISQITESFLDLLTRYLTSKTTHFSTTSSSPSPWPSFMSESYTFNLQSPLSAIVHPRARYALERALTRPSDYLGCDCCVPEGGVILDKSTLPTTSLLLSMLNEAGSIINVRDLWDAFRDTIAPTVLESEMRGGAGRDDEKDREGSEGEGEGIDEANEQKLLALFYRSLAELRHLGLIRQSKRKPGVDCIAKTAWMGL
ncbi:Origin recognition complex subunit 3 [Exophiala xenobiotica]|nr:Origin recognition complex subunit 3 [Exophiala xenobiotica]KAK5229857.1 Origin recognition complex subunit 3 [Exophiala xenobiotica]KAK5295824.1 Origin recognition complex subunit 3 [Exophiala xenobiotica]KAK5372357.1 Origin recognition complex subunit 3 [Exophiala xenobiotica]KAK5397245.1 Origin recognition complex subunit 3 [Exophiala xenobiotica]